MTLRPKPDSSHASNRLTRRNGPTQHLLSSFNNTSGHEVESETQDGETHDGPERDFKRKAEEPATDDEPVSSSEDNSSESDSSQSAGSEAKTMTQTTKTLEEKLGDGNEVTTSQPKSSRSARSAPSSQISGSLETDNSSSRKVRTISDLADSNEELQDDEHPFFSSYRSSQSSKRHKTNTYAKPRLPTYARAPNSGARSSTSSEERSPDTTKRKSKSNKKKQTAQKDASSPSSPGVTFKEPMQIDLPSSRKPSAEFKFPASFPIDSISSSSMGTSSFKDPQPMLLDDEDFLSSETSLSSPSPSILEDLTPDEYALSGVREPSPPRKALCPMCKVEVDPELLMRFEAQPKQRVREQQQFCASHKQLSAKSEWKASGYPTIDWETFDERVQRYFPDLAKLLVPDCSSYYRNVLESNKSGKARNFRLTLADDDVETISCGYYGPKGATKMLEAVMDRFSGKLRRLAASDHIIRTASVSGYAQSVLVPELAVLLVKEDMGVSDHSARQILRDSLELGHTVNPAPNDNVPIPAET